MILETPIDLDERAQEKRRESQRNYNRSTAGRKRKLRYQKQSGKNTTTRAYLRKPFIGVDGESVTLENGKQNYVHLALSTGESITDPNGLSTLHILTFLSRNLPESKYGISVIYGGGYDFNFWVKDLPRPKLKALYEATFRDSPVTVGAFEIRWQVGKSFTIKSSTKTVTVQDVSSFFQCPFIDALDEWLGDDYEGRDVIATGKSQRDSFAIEDLDFIISYNRVELLRLVDLASVLRERLDKVNMRPRRWTGPGNSVSTLFRRHDIKAHMDNRIPAPVASASRYAYAGGRIEMCRYGRVSKRHSYQYDKNSAYPEAIAELPSLAGGTWRYVEGDPGDHEFALYKVSVYAKNAFHPTPVFTRGALGAICYPLYAFNWVWSPEMKAIRQWKKRLGGRYNIVEAWIFEPATAIKPFAWIKECYRQRAELKAAGDPAQLAVKTVMQAVYGKLAQQLGFLEAKGRRAEEIPPYHQLEWAGFVTSYTRAQMYLAALENPSAVIAFETDALFMAEPLEGITIGTGLGEWKVTEYTDLAYVQSGIYCGTTVDGEEVVKVRGFNVKSVTREAIIDTLNKRMAERHINAPETRFIGLGIALQMPELKFWLQWIDQERILRCYPMGKRIHELCGCGAVEQDGLLLEFWHQTICPVQEQVSVEYPVQWINPDPELERLHEMRKMISEWD